MPDRCLVNSLEITMTTGHLHRTVSRYIDVHILRYILRSIYIIYIQYIYSSPPGVAKNAPALRPRQVRRRRPRYYTRTAHGTLK